MELGGGRRHKGPGRHSGGVGRRAMAERSRLLPQSHRQKLPPISPTASSSLAVRRRLPLPRRPLPSVGSPNHRPLATEIPDRRRVPLALNLFPSGRRKGPVTAAPPGDVIIFLCCRSSD
ncbi:hypothetical protein E3N88_38229 [Mikania micrantha]|uniref:Uncharacterized protein n=1 Tax=Mikania micrantha TaxID=192012 RepID=A0A5N6LVX5_9ASTR|nr:hypothetical protein E3N88_38229 [Mikania micrantha]